MVNVSTQINVGIQSAHNTSADVIQQFNGASDRYQVINPTLDNITFFHPHLSAGVTSPQEHVDFFSDVHEALSDSGGLSAVILFGNNALSKAHTALEITEGLQQKNKDLPLFFIACSSKLADIPNCDGVFTTIVQGQGVESESKEKLMTSLNLSYLPKEKGVSYVNKTEIKQQYFQQYPNLSRAVEKVTSKRKTSGWTNGMF